MEVAADQPTALPEPLPVDALADTPAAQQTDRLPAALQDALVQGWVAGGRRRNRTKDIKVGNELHLAMERGAWGLCVKLIEGAPELLWGKNKSGCTALMLAAMGKCPKGVLEVMLAHGAGDTAAEKRQHKTAADYAELYGKHGLAGRLRSLEMLSPVDNCGLCGERANPHNKVVLLGEQVDRGEETNPSILLFYSEEWADVPRSLKGLPFHTLTGATFHFRKELSETMAVAELLGHLLGRHVHLVDFLCGKSLTTAVVALKYGCPVTAVDKLEPNQLPHYAHTGLDVTYLQGDVLDSGFVDRFVAHLEAVGLPTVLVSVHSCGLLGMLAAKLFHTIDLIQSVLLIPCCWPAQADPRSPPELFETSNESERHQRWAECLRQAVGPQATMRTMDHVVSPRRTAILGMKERQNVAKCSASCFQQEEFNLH